MNSENGNPLRREPWLGRAMSALLGLVMAGLLTAAEAPGQARQDPRQPHERSVQVSARAGKPGSSGVQVILLTVEIAKGWHLTANPAGIDELTGDETSVVVKSKAVSGVKIDYPIGDIVDVAGFKWRIYQGIIKIRLQFKREQPSTGPLELEVLCRPRTWAHCYPPLRIKITVE